MDILFLVSQLPYPPDTGAKIRVLNLIKQTAKQHRITLVTFGSRDKESDKLKTLEKYCQAIYLVEQQNRTRKAAILLNFFSRLPFNIEKYYSMKMEKLILDLVTRKEFDLIHCDSLQVSYNIFKIKALPKVLVEHNVEAQIIERYAEKESNPLKRAVIRYQYNKLLAYEINACRFFDEVGAVSPEDKQLLERISNRDGIHVVANGVDTDYFAFHGDDDRQVFPKALVFTGSLDWLPNEDGLIYFFSQIHPILKRKVPDMRVTIVGRNPGSMLFEIAKEDPSVTITGRVDDVRPYMCQGQVFFVPLRIGGGTRLKILEAMSFGKPVVSTRIGAEGINVTSGKDILLADTPETFTDSIVKLFTDDRLRATIIENARKKVESEYSWNIISNDLMRLWEMARGK